MDSHASERHILVIDDDEGIQEGLEALLTDEGYRVSCAENGREALELLRAGNRPLPSAILLDLMMPVMDGFEFFEERSRSPELASLPVIVLTAGAINERVTRLGASDHLRKPIDIDRLLELLATHAAPAPEDVPA